MSIPSYSPVGLHRTLEASPAVLGQVVSWFDAFELFLLNAYGVDQRQAILSNKQRFYQELDQFLHGSVIESM